MTTSSLERWMKAFPDPSNSPAHHARTLGIRGSEIFYCAGTGARAWFGFFDNMVTRLFVNTFEWDSARGITLVSKASVTRFHRDDYLVSRS